MASATGSTDRNKKTERESPSNEGEKTEVSLNDWCKKARLVRSGLLLSGAELVILTGGRLSLTNMKIPVVTGSV